MVITGFVFECFAGIICIISLLQIPIYRSTDMLQ